MFWGQQASTNFQQEKKKSKLVKHETCYLARNNYWFVFKSGKREELDCLFYKEIWKVVGEAQVLLLGLGNSQKLLLELWEHGIAIWQDTGVFMHCRNEGGCLLKR